MKNTMIHAAVATTPRERTGAPVFVAHVERTGPSSAARYVTTAGAPTTGARPGARGCCP